MNDKYTILKASESFSREQRQRKITKEDVYEVSHFSTGFSDQMLRDMKTGFKFWDSCSMLEQTDCLFDNDRDRAIFVKWVFKKLNETK